MSDEFYQPALWDTSEADEEELEVSTKRHPSTAKHSKIEESSKQQELLPEDPLA